YDYMNETGGSTKRRKVYQYLRLYQYSDFIQGTDGELTLDPSLPQPNTTVHPGDAMYADLNGDNVVDDKDMARSGYSERPEYVFGVNAGFTYKGFNFSMQWSGAAHVN